jgi:hypothetical protein
MISILKNVNINNYNINLFYFKYGHRFLGPIKELWKESRALVEE